MGEAESAGLSEEQILVNRWEKYNLLKGVDDDFKADVAVALENQRLYNEVDDDWPGLARFKRISVPMVRRVMTGVDRGRHSFGSGISKVARRRHFSDINLWRTLDEKFASCRQQHNLDTEARLIIEHVAEIVSKIEKIASFEKEEKPDGKFVFYCLGVDHRSGELVMFYDFK